MSQDPRTILFVCTANICRSPMAEKLLEHALDNEQPPLDTLETASAGVAAVPGEPASRNSVKALGKVGLNLEEHRSQPVTEALLSRSLAVFCMTESHRRLIAARFPDFPEHLYLIRQFLPESSGAEVPDPYGADLESYEACRDSIVEAIPSLVRFLKTIVPESRA